MGWIDQTFVGGRKLEATDAECVLTMLDLATGQIDEASFASWLRTQIVKT